MRVWRVRGVEGEGEGVEGEGGEGEGVEGDRCGVWRVKVMWRLKVEGCGG